MRGDRSGARTSVSELARVVREHDLPLFRAVGEFLIGWATADGGAPADGLAAMRRGAGSLRQQNALAFDGLIKIACVLEDQPAQMIADGRLVRVLEEWCPPFAGYHVKDQRAKSVRHPGPGMTAMR